jgi:hypothetical protein
MVRMRCSNLYASAVSVSHRRACRGATSGTWHRLDHETAVRWSKVTLWDELRRTSPLRCRIFALISTGEPEGRAMHVLWNPPCEKSTGVSGINDDKVPYKLQSCNQAIRQPLQRNASGGTNNVLSLLNGRSQSSFSVALVPVALAQISAFVQIG